MIAQLRQARKSTIGEAEGAQVERDQLRSKCAAQEIELQRLRLSTQQASAQAGAAERLQADLSDALERLEFLEQSLSEAKQVLAQAEKTAYDKGAAVEVLRADKALLEQELKQRYLEGKNLKEALQQVEAESTVMERQLRREIADKVEATRRQCEEVQRQVELECSERMDELRHQVQAAEEAQRDQELLRRKAEIDFNKDKRKMQRTLENTLAQLNNSQQDVIDRTLVANLIVSYFQRRRYVKGIL